MKDQQSLALFYILSFATILICLDYYYLIDGQFLGLDQLGELNLKIESLIGRSRFIFRMAFFIGFSPYCYFYGNFRNIDIKRQYSMKERFGFLLTTVFFFLLMLSQQENTFPVLFYPIGYLGTILGVIFTLRSFVGRLSKSSVKNASLSPEKDRIDNEESFSVESTDGGYFNIPNPKRGIFLAGSSGAGKSSSWFYPIIEQCIQKNYAMIVYDYKYPSEKHHDYTLINKVYTSTQKFNKANPGNKRSLFYLNYYEPEKSHRCNFLKPEYLVDLTYVTEIIETLLVNLDKEAYKKKDFWFLNAKALATATTWYLKKNYPQYCTLPHLVCLVNNERFGELLDLLKEDEEIAPIISMLTTAKNLKAGPQLSGAISTLQGYFINLLNKRVFWVHSGNDFDLDISDPNDIKQVVVGSHQTLEVTLAPVISCVVSTVTKFLNQPGKSKSIVMLDEGPQLFIPKLSKLPATARSNKVCLLYSAQDLSLMIEEMGKEATESLLSNLNYQIVGSVRNVNTAETIAKFIGKDDKEIEGFSQSQSHNNTGGSSSVNINVQQRYIIEPDTIVNLEKGEFVGLFVDSAKKKIQGKVKYVEEDLLQVPKFAKGVDLDANYKKIYAEAQMILDGKPAMTA